jgi:hypothetical protein
MGSDKKIFGVGTMYLRERKRVIMGDNKHRGGRE